MFRHLRPALLAVVAGSALLCGMATRASPPLPEGPADEDFIGKVVFVQTQRQAVTLEKARARHLGGRAFVVGRVVDDETVTRPQFAGLTLWLPLSEVTRMVVSDNLEQFQKSCKAGRGG
jgi:hypothetical protein